MAKLEGNARKVVIAALVGNGFIALSKFVGAWLSGSVAMLAEGVHSVADTVNQSLLLLGMNLSDRKDPILYPLGRHRESYFWAFIVALTLFFLGGVYATYEGVHSLSSNSGPPGSPWAALAVLGASLAFETGSFVVAFREFNRDRAGKSVREALFGGKNPTIPLVLLEDTGALLGLVVAFVAVVTSWLTGSRVADSVGSIVIGVLLCGIGLLLAHDTRSLLIGESATPEVQRQALEIVKVTPGVEEVTQLIAAHLGPDTVLLALKLRFTPGMSAEEAGRVVNDVEARVRERLPQMKRIFIEPDTGPASTATT